MKGFRTPLYANCWPLLKGAPSLLSLPKTEHDCQGYTQSPGNKNDGWPAHIDAIASQVIHPEQEGGQEWITRVLSGLGYPLREVYQYASAVSRDLYDFEVTTKAEHRSLHDLNRSLKGVETVWVDLSQDSPLIGHTLLESSIRLRSGASVVAVVHSGQLIPNPKSMKVFETRDRPGLIGNASQIESALTLIESPLTPAPGNAPRSTAA